MAPTLGISLTIHSTLCPNVLHCSGWKRATSISQPAYQLGMIVRCRPWQVERSWYPTLLPPIWEVGVMPQYTPVILRPRGQRPYLMRIQTELGRGSACKSIIKLAQILNCDIIDV